MTRPMFNVWRLLAACVLAALTFNACTNVTPNRVETKAFERACIPGRPCQTP